VDLSTVTSLRPARHRDDLRLGPGETVLGGGSWLFSEPQPGTTGLVDLTTLGWEPWTVGPDGLELAATCTIAELLRLPTPAEWVAAPLLRQCAEAFLMSFKIWNTATVGGNLCLALPAGAMISLAVALDAQVLVWTPSGGERREDAASFVTGVRTTTLRPGEVVRAVLVPAAALRGRTAFRKIALTPLGRSSAVVVGRLDDAGFALTVTASTPRPYVLRFDTVPTDAAITEAVAALDDWYDDPHGAPDWRAAITSCLAREVCAELRP
jgi:CO/xanthine dehydrogenase FAD-binding subunit